MTSNRVLEAGLLSETIAVKRSGPPMIEQGIALRELQHRMANTLAILQAHCRLEFAGIDDPALRDALHRHETRLLRLSELHHFLARGAGRGEIEAADYFHSLCDVLSRSILAPQSIHCEATVGEGALDGTTCECLGLIVAELVMNASKHAFSDRSCARVRIEAYAPDGMAWCCTVSDNGCGMAHAPASGAGSRIVDALVEILDGQLAVDTGSTGTTVTIRFPAPLQRTALHINARNR